MKELQELVAISNHYGRLKEYVIAGGGNTSYKNDNYVWVKASGTTLADITIDGFAVLDREKLKVIAHKKYSDQSDVRENEIKVDLFKSSVYPEKNLRPSVETSMHEIIDYPFVVHTHPTIANSLLCSQNAQKLVSELFGDAVLFIPYTDPGYILFKEVETELLKYRAKFKIDPKVIFLQNHGVFVSAASIEEIKIIYNDIESKLNAKIAAKPDLNPISINETVTEILPALRMIASKDSIKLAAIRNNKLIQEFCQSEEHFNQAALPFTPDIIVYCKARPLFISSDKAADIIIEFKEKYEQYTTKYGYAPKVALLKKIGLIALEENIKSVQIVLDVFEDLLKISFYSRNFGGPKFMNEREIAFIDNWEVENYRRAVSKGTGAGSVVENKVIIVTGAAQGFGAGIAEMLFDAGANLVIADLNAEKGNELAANLNLKAKKNRAVFVIADVSNENSIKSLMVDTVANFGGLDAFISNAGILRAGGLDEMSLESFELMTKVNYSAYFICTKYASAVLKLQSQYKDDYFTDIIQINSKSGLKGSNRNFAYAGGKFGGIGLTQSFALELMPHKIKVNSICPGNFFEGPLWSDPEKGLFVQYLRAGKVPGAKSIEDVKRFYENQVPAKRGCFVQDVVKAIKYVIDQQYETGQAVPVTGGQEMLK